MREFRMVSVSGILGYGSPEASLDAALARGVDMIGRDGGSSEPGPYYLGSGRPFVSPRALRRNLRLMLLAAIHTCGRDGMMGVREPMRDVSGAHELGFLVDVVAGSADVAEAVIALARTSMLHADFPGRLCREGNVAFPFSPSDLMAGEVYRFSMSHVVVPDDPCEMFPIEYEKV